MARSTHLGVAGLARALLSAVIAVALAAAPAALAEAPKVIRIGAVYPLTGNIASTGLDCRRGAELAVDIINGKYDLDLPLARAEGLPSLGGAKLELVFGDTKGEPKNGIAEVERLVTPGEGGGDHRRVPELGDEDGEPGHRAAQDPLRLLRLVLPHPHHLRLSATSSARARTTRSSPATSSTS